MKRLGIDIGASSIKLTLLNKEEDVLKFVYRLHHGKPIPLLIDLLGTLITEINHLDNLYILTCGIESSLLKLPMIGDVIALTEGAKKIAPLAKSVITIGSQSARYITSLKNNTPQFTENNSCASGTGSFFENQMTRLGLPIEEYSSIINQAKSIPSIAGRCSVFAKTDIIHRQQEGVPTADILLGLCYASIRSYKSTIAGKLKDDKPILLASGIGYNSGVIQAIKDIFKLSECDLLLPDGFACTQALGAAILANKKGSLLPLQDLINLCKKANKTKSYMETSKLLPLTPPPSISNLHNTRSYIPGESCYLGIDIGSTSTNIVLIGEDENVIETLYIRTKGNPKKAVSEGFKQIREKYGDKIIIKSVATTGSGRMLIGNLIGADCIKDEITAQATSAAHFIPDVDTVFEIGGQDSKYISLQNGYVNDFLMNKICAAGTGSFIEEQAAKLNIPISQYGDFALKSKSPADLGERCTVFIESRISSFLAAGVSRENIAAGLCYSIINNYFKKVVGTKPIGNRILLQGGVAYNPGIVAAFKSIFGDKVSVAPFFSVSGAVGAALLGKLEIGEKTSTFKGLSFNKWDDFTLKAQSISNDKTNESLDNLYNNTQIKERKTIGIPRSLINYDIFPIFNKFFQLLGYNVLLSDISNNSMLTLAQEHIKEEVCYPLKLAVGHTLSLIQQKVDYIFMPSIHGKGICVYMQKSPQILDSCVNFKKHEIKLLSPDLCVDKSKSFSTACFQMAKQLGHTNIKALLPLFKSGALSGFNKLKKSPSELTKTLDDKEIGFVLVSRSYGLTDPILSLSIKRKLEHLGYKVYNLPCSYNTKDSNIKSECSDVYWPFGRDVLNVAKELRENPNLYPIYLTFHGCGPDTMLTHWFENKIGNKPYLPIEVDEHSSPIGIITRLEAFVNSVSNRTKENIKLPMKSSETNETRFYDNINKSSRKIPIAIPNIYPYSSLLKSYLIKNGYNLIEMPPTSLKALNTGRSLMKSKEYFSLMALLGDCIESIDPNKEVQILYPQNIGAENNGLYSNFIKSKLDTLGYNKTTIIAPLWESMIKNKSNTNTLFSIFLAGDIILCAPKSIQGNLLKKIKKTFLSGTPTERDFIDWASFSTYKSDSKYILCGGEPECFLNSLFRETIETCCEKSNYSIKYAPLSEMLLFEMIENGIKVLEKESIIQKVSNVLGNASPFSKSISYLRNISNEMLNSIESFNGRCSGCSVRCIDCKCRVLSTGARWRIGKTFSIPKGYSGLIRASSMYENISSILNLIDNKSDSKYFNLHFEGSINTIETARIDTWLHYLE